MKPIWYVSGKPLQESFQRRCLLLTVNLLVAQRVKNPPAMQETWFHAWFGTIPWRRKWESTPVFLPGEFHEQRSLAGYSPWGHKELDVTEWLTWNWCFWTVVLEKTLESPLDCKEIQTVHPKGDQSWVFIGRTGVEAKTQLWPPDVKNWPIWKDPNAGKDWGQKEKGTIEDEMVGWHHWLNGHGFRWTPGVGDGQGGLACCGSWGHKESDKTEWLNWTECYILHLFQKWF